MDASKIFVCMFYVLLYAGISDQIPHNKIVRNTINNSVVFNNTIDDFNNIIDDFNNRSDELNNTTDASNNTKDIGNFNDTNTNVLGKLAIKDFHVIQNETDTTNNTGDLKNVDNFINENLINKSRKLNKKLNDIEDKIDKVMFYVNSSLEDADEFFHFDNAINDLEKAITTTTEKVITCITSWDDFGACVQRQNCDYSTSAIDLTLYEKGGHKSTCTVEGMICCPIESQLPKKKDYFSFLP